ncbi:hypothetical protein [Peribacillus muralis]|nr:hypothetical protein [Peribacillus muralis]
MNSEAKIKSKQPVQTNEQKLSEREWKELMGIGRPVYRRHRGSLRQK